MLRGESDPRTASDESGIETRFGFYLALDCLGFHLKAFGREMAWTRGYGWTLD